MLILNQDQTFVFDTLTRDSFSVDYDADGKQCCVYWYNSNDEVIQCLGSYKNVNDAYQALILLGQSKDTFAMPQDTRQIS